MRVKNVLCKIIHKPFYVQFNIAQCAQGATHDREDIWVAGLN